MKEADHKNLERLLTIEKAVNEMIAVREQIAGLKVGMKALQASEEKFKTLVENIPQKMYLKDRNSVYVFGNGKYAADLKMKAEDIAGKTDYEFFPRELAEKYASDDKRIMATGQLENIEEEYVHEGETFVVHTVKTPVKDEKGEPLGILGIFWDITQQKRNEEEMKKNLAALEELVSDREAELESVDNQLQREIAHQRRVKQQLQEMDEMFWTFFENTGTASVVIEESLTIILANREFEKLSGYHKEEVEWEKGLAEFLTPDGVEKIKEFCLTGKPDLEIALRDYECQFNGHEGTTTNIRITGAKVPGVRKAVISLLDITARKRTEESLGALQEKYQTLVENTREAILVVQDGLLKYGNPRMTEILGYTEEGLISRPFEEFIHLEDRGVVEDHLKKLRDGESPQVHSFRMIHRDGDVRWLENRAVLIQWEARPAALNFITDITDRKKVEEEFRDSIRPLQAPLQALEKIFVILNQG